MTEHTLAWPSGSPVGGDPLITALRGLDLPPDLLEEVAEEKSPRERGHVLLGFALESEFQECSETARQLFRALREHPPTPELGQIASVELAQSLRESGDEAEADRIGDELLRSGDLLEEPAAHLGEGFQEIGRLPEALRCFDIACRTLLEGNVEDIAGADPLLLDVLVRRARTRAALGMEADAHDEAAAGAARAAMRRLWGFSLHVQALRQGLSAGLPGENVQLLLSREEFGRAGKQVLPAGEGPDSYYRTAENLLREHGHRHPEARRGVLLTGVEEVLGAAPEQDLDPAEPETYLTLARAWTVGGDPRALAWPPERGQACWCASGRTYGECCGIPSAP